MLDDGWWKYWKLKNSQLQPLWLKHRSPINRTRCHFSRWFAFSLEECSKSHLFQEWKFRQNVVVIVNAKAQKNLLFCPNGHIVFFSIISYATQYKILFYGRFLEKKHFWPFANSTLDHLPREKMKCLICGKVLQIHSLVREQRAPEGANDCQPIGNQLFWAKIGRNLTGNRQTISHLSPVWANTNREPISFNGS